MPILKVVLTDYWFDKIESGEKNTSSEKQHFFGKSAFCLFLKLSKMVSGYPKTTLLLNFKKHIEKILKK